MAPHLTHVGVHDHGFNNVSTYGALWRLAREGRFDAPPWELQFYELALKVSGAVQARRWTPLPDGGYIYSFNGAHSLFVDTIRSLRALAVAHMLGHRLFEEQDASDQPARAAGAACAGDRALRRLLRRGRDTYDVRGRTAHESLFNVANGTYRGPNRQQGYSPFSTWTRGLAWAMTGFAEQLEFIADAPRRRLGGGGQARAIERWMLEAARATCDFYIDQGDRRRRRAVLGHRRARAEPLGDWAGRPADPFNDHEPVDSSAAAIAAQGLLRPRRVLARAAKTAAATSRPACACSRCSRRPAAVSVDRRRPPGPAAALDLPPAERLGLRAGGLRIPRGESSQWGDYHLREGGAARAPARRASRT